jgi:hypothetical protein
MSGDHCEYEGELWVGDHPYPADLWGRFPRMLVVPSWFRSPDDDGRSVREYLARVAQRAARKVRAARKRRRGWA